MSLSSSVGVHIAAGRCGVVGIGGRPATGEVRCEGVARPSLGISAMKWGVTESRKRFKSRKKECEAGLPFGDEKRRWIKGI